MISPLLSPMCIGGIIDLQVELLDLGICGVGLPESITLLYQSYCLSWHGIYNFWDPSGGDELFGGIVYDIS